MRGTDGVSGYRFNMEREAREETMESAREEDAQADTLKLYETQFFGFTPQTCMLRVYSAFMDTLCEILPVVEKVCVRQLSKGESDEAEELLRSRSRECSRQLQLYLEQKFETLSKKMEEMLVGGCLSVPPNVLLPEDKSHKSYPQDPQEVLRLESSIADLQKAYEAEVCARQALLAELEEQKEAQKQLDDILAWVRELQTAWVNAGNGSFQDSFKLAMESVKQLQQAVKEISRKAPH